ncbi:MAG: hypothetical protein EOS78_26820 [Mesorhizobium sp.]|nr:MAG: hypothetical protein EOS78_26820 [Mesorhizobium sp.]
MAHNLAQIASINLPAADRAIVEMAVLADYFATVPFAWDRRAEVESFVMAILKSFGRLRLIQPNLCTVRSDSSTTRNQCSRPEQDRPDHGAGCAVKLYTRAECDLHAMASAAGRTELK